MHTNGSWMWMLGWASLTNPSRGRSHGSCVYSLGVELTRNQFPASGNMLQSKLLGMWSSRDLCTTSPPGVGAFDFVSRWLTSSILSLPPRSNTTSIGLASNGSASAQQEVEILTTFGRVSRDLRHLETRQLWQESGLLC